MELLLRAPAKAGFKGVGFWGVIKGGGERGRFWSVKTHAALMKRMAVS